MLLNIALVLGTIHGGAGAGAMNNVNPGLIVTAPEVATCAPLAGAYYNSERRLSMLAGCRIERETGPVTLGLTVAGITGYRAMAVTPAVLPSVSYRGFTATFLPPASIVGAKSEVFGVNFSYQFSTEF